jgi:hypothetical protein
MDTTAEESGEKVLERLVLFSDQRGFAVNAPIVEEPPQTRGLPGTPPDGGTDQPVTRSRDNVTEEEAGAFAAEDIATMYIEAAQALDSSGAQPRAAPPPEATQPPASRAAAVPTWRLIGPLRIPNGQTYGANRVDVAGRVSAVAVDPMNGNHILCGAAGGGIW